MTDLPTVDELRAIARSAFARGALNDLAFAERELTLLGARDVYAAEFRRHELLRRGFTPPEDMMTNPTSLTPLLDEIARLKDELQAANARADLAEQLREETLVHMGAQCDELRRRLASIEEDKIRGSAGPGKFVMIGDGVYGSVKLPDHLFSRLDSRHFIAHSTADRKFMCANPEEADHLKSLGVQMDGISCDRFRIDRITPTAPADADHPAA